MAYMNHEHYNDPTAGALFRKKETYIDPKLLKNSYKPTTRTLALREKDIARKTEMEKARAIKQQKKMNHRKQELQTIVTACEHMELKISRYDSMIATVVTEIGSTEARRKHEAAQEAIKQARLYIKALSHHVEMIRGLL